MAAHALHNRIKDISNTDPYLTYEVCKINFVTNRKFQLNNKQSATNDDYKKSQDRPTSLDQMINRVAQ